MTPVKIKLETASLSVLEALAKSYARDIDRGEDDTEELRGELERVFTLIPDAKQERFA